MHFKSASVVCSGWAGARPPRAPSAPEPLRAACLPVFAAGGKTWCSGTVGQPLRHGTVRILVLRPPLRAGLAAGAGRAGPGGLEMPLCPAGAVCSSRKQGRRPEQAGAEEPPRPHSAMALPQAVPSVLLPVVSRVQGLGRGAGHLCFVPFPCRVPEPPREAACPPAQLGSGLQGPESLVHGGPACFCLSCPLCAAAAGAGGHHSPESALPVAGPGPGPGPARQCSLSPGVEPAAGFHGEPHGRGRGCHKSGNIGHKEDGRLATSLGIAAVSTLGTTQAGPPAVHH